MFLIIPVAIYLLAHYTMVSRVVSNLTSSIWPFLSSFKSFNKFLLFFLYDYKKTSADPPSFYMYFISYLNKHTLIFGRPNLMLITFSTLLPEIYLLNSEFCKFTQTHMYLQLGCANNHTDKSKNKIIVIFKIFLDFQHTSIFICICAHSIMKVWQKYHTHYFSILKQFISVNVL